MKLLILVLAAFFFAASAYRFSVGDNIYGAIDLFIAVLDFGYFLVYKESK